MRFINIIWSDMTIVIELISESIDKTFLCISKYCKSKCHRGQTYCLSFCDIQRIFYLIRVIIMNEICKQLQLLLAHFIPTSQYTYQYYMTGICLHWGICSEAPILTKVSSKFVWENNRNAYLKDDFSANDDNTYKILPFTLPPY